MNRLPLKLLSLAILNLATGIFFAVVAPYKSLDVLTMTLLAALYASIALLTLLCSLNQNGQLNQLHGGGKRTD